jgi:FkbM family methyltransferase
MQIIDRIFYGVSFFPVKTLPKRLVNRFFFIGKYVFAFWFNFFGYRGCRSIGKKFNNEVEILEILKNGPLGLRGETFLLPKDDVMFKFVRAYGFWEKEESNFFVEEIQSCKSFDSIVFVDIGANCGLITRQILNKLNDGIKVVAVEPLSLHVKSLRHNLEKFNGNHDIEIIEAALDTNSGMDEIFVDLNNRGNTGLMPMETRNQHFAKEKIRKILPEKFSHKFESKNLKIFLKSDIQGLDAKILKRINFWADVEAAVVEIWAVKNLVKSDVEATIGHFGQMNTWYWDNDPKKSANRESVMKFWLSGSSQMKNLYLKKS